MSGVGVGRNCCTVNEVHCDIVSVGHSGKYILEV